MRCRTCQYSLEHLTEQRCPECGRGFDPGDPRTFDTGSGSRIARRLGRLMVDALIIALLLDLGVFVFFILMAALDALPRSLW